MSILKDLNTRLMLTAMLIFTPGVLYANEMDLMYEFQLDQLLVPSNEQLTMEKEGHIFIYNGLKDSDIQLALDTQQHRMQSMMFVNVVWTDKEGNPIVDPYTGEIVSDDDC